MSESFSCLRFWRRHPKGHLIGIEGVDPITIGDGQWAKVERPEQNLWKGEDCYPDFITKKWTPVGPRKSVGPVYRVSRQARAGTRF